MQLHHVTADGQDRSYRVFVPPTLDRSRLAPLVMVLHGGNNTAEDMAKATLFDQEAAAGGFIAAYPEGLGKAWNAGTCYGAAPRRGTDDVGFGAAVRLVTVQGAGHIWFASGLGPANGALDATSTIWRFFSELR